MSKLPCLKRENHFCAVLSAIEPSPHTAQMFRLASATLEPRCTRKEESVGNIHFPQLDAPVLILKMLYH
jgi:hypothetical protein